MITRATHLSAPVAEIVQGHDLPAARFVQIREERADDGTSEVADVERLCDVGRRVLDDDSLTLAETI